MFHNVPPRFDALTSYTKYPFILLVPQNTVERVLRRHINELAITVRRPCKVVDLQSSQDNLDYTRVVFDDGRSIEARYIVGADGARSTVSFELPIHCSSSY